jgi:hypothetical protein
MQREGTVAEPTIATGHNMQIFNDLHYSNFRNVLSLLEQHDQLPWLARHCHW